MEIDVDRQGKLVIEKNIWSKLQVRLGAIHYMSSFDSVNQNLAVIYDEFLFLTEAICQSGIDILVHPFRVFLVDTLPLLMYPVLRKMQVLPFVS